MFNLCTRFLSVSQCSFSAFWRPKNAVSAHSSTDLIKSMILIYFYEIKNHRKIPPLSQY